VAEVDDTGQ